MKPYFRVGGGGGGGVEGNRGCGKLGKLRVRRTMTPPGLSLLPPPSFPPHALPPLSLPPSMPCISIHSLLMFLLLKQIIRLSVTKKRRSVRGAAVWGKLCRHRSASRCWRSCGSTRDEEMIMPRICLDCLLVSHYFLSHTPLSSHSRPHSLILLSFPIYSLLSSRFYLDS